MGSGNKNYKSANAAKMNAGKSKPQPRDSKQFKGGSNKHNGASISQSGQQKRR